MSKDKADPVGYGVAESIDDLRKIYQSVKDREERKALKIVLEMATCAAYNGKSLIEVEPSAVLKGRGYDSEGFLTVSFVKLLECEGFTVEDVSVSSVSSGIYYQISGWDKAAENTAIL